MPMPDFEALARDIQNRASDRVGAAATETRHFREFFGTSVLVVNKYGKCSRGIPSSQRVSAQSISMARYVPFCCNIPLPFLLSMVYSFIGFVICGQHC